MKLTRKRARELALEALGVPNAPVISESDDSDAKKAWVQLRAALEHARQIVDRKGGSMWSFDLAALLNSPLAGFLEAWMRNPDWTAMLQTEAAKHRNGIPVWWFRGGKITRTTRRERALMAIAARIITVKATDTFEEVIDRAEETIKKLEQRHRSKGGTPKRR